MSTEGAPAVDRSNRGIQGSSIKVESRRWSRCVYEGWG